MNIEEKLYQHFHKKVNENKKYERKTYSLKFSPKPVSKFNLFQQMIGVAVLSVFFMMILFVDKTPFPLSKPCLENIQKAKNISVKDLKQICLNSKIKFFKEKNL